MTIAMTGSLAAVSDVLAAPVISSSVVDDVLAAAHCQCAPDTAHKQHVGDRVERRRRHPLLRADAVSQRHGIAVDRAPAFDDDAAAQCNLIHASGCAGGVEAAKDQRRCAIGSTEQARFLIARRGALVEQWRSSRLPAADGTDEAALVDGRASRQRRAVDGRAARLWQMGEGPPMVPIVSLLSAAAQATGVGVDADVDALTEQLIGPIT